jgi:hypothetical protein
MNDVFISIVTEPEAAAAGIVGVGNGEGREGPPDADEENVFTVLISVLMGKERILSI